MTLGKKRLILHGENTPKKISDILLPISSINLLLKNNPKITDGYRIIHTKICDKLYIRK